MKGTILKIRCQTVRYYDNWHHRNDQEWRLQGKRLGSLHSDGFVDITPGPLYKGFEVQYESYLEAKREFWHQVGIKLNRGRYVRAMELKVGKQIIMYGKYMDAIEFHNLPERMRNQAQIIAHDPRNCKLFVLGTNALAKDAMLATIKSLLVLNKRQRPNPTNIVLALDNDVKLEHSLNWTLFRPSQYVTDELYCESCRRVSNFDPRFVDLGLNNITVLCAMCRDTAVDEGTLDPYSFT